MRDREVSEMRERVWAGADGDKLEYIVWPERGLVHLKVVDGDCTLCNCGTYGPWVLSGGPAADDLCPGCSERLGLLKNVQVVFHALSSLLPAGMPPVCVTCGREISQGDTWHGEMKAGTDWYARFLPEDLDHYHLSCWRNSAR